ncbi:MAG: hypothetical protein ACKVS9_15395 [Phycisphaerae bacterium]
MSFSAEVVDVLIGSAADTADERDSVEKTITSWNAIHAKSRSLIFRPVRWESASIPDFGVPAQEAINKQLVDDCDLMVAIIRVRIGEGTIAEIKWLHEGGKSVHVYLYCGDISVSTPANELKRSQEFRDQLKSNSLYAEYRDTRDLESKITALLSKIEPSRTRTKPSDVSESKAYPNRELMRDLYKHAQNAYAELQRFMFPASTFDLVCRTSESTFEEIGTCACELANRFASRIDEEVPFIPANLLAVMQDARTAFCDAACKIQEYRRCFRWSEVANFLRAHNSASINSSFGALDAYVKNAIRGA